MATAPALPTEPPVALLPAPDAPEVPAPEIPSRSDAHPHRFEPAPADPVSWRTRLRGMRLFLLFVVAPTLLAAIFEYGVVADQYESETHFVVRTSSQSGTTGSGIGQLLGLNTNPASADNQTVVDYLLSHDAVATLDRSLGLTTIFRRPEADVFTRLSDEAEPETLLKYYRDMVHVDFDHESGITRVGVRAFRPEDARRIAAALLKIGETQVNTFNRRALDSGLAVARDQLDAAERAVAQTQGRMTAFRQAGRDIDPEKTSTARITMVTQMQAELARARAQLAGMGGTLRPNSPQYATLAGQVRALEQQVDAARGSLAGQGQATAVGLGRFEGLRVRQEFASKRFDAASAALEAARAQAMQQQLFLVRVVEPNLPGKSLYPQRLKIIATIFFALLASYAVGWLILAGVREHAA